MLFSRRLPHVVTQRDLVLLLAPTYAAAREVDDEEAAERLSRALTPAALADLYEALSGGLAAAKGPRTTEDAVMDKVSAGIAKSRSRAKAAAATPAISAALVRLDLEIGLAPESMRETLASPRGAAILAAGWKELGAHLAKELTR